MLTHLFLGLLLVLFQHQTNAYLQSRTDGAIEAIAVLAQNITGDFVQGNSVSATNLQVDGQDIRELITEIVAKYYTNATSVVDKCEDRVNPPFGTWVAEGVWGSSRCYNTGSGTPWTRMFAVDLASAPDFHTDFYARTYGSPSSDTTEFGFYGAHRTFTEGRVVIDCGTRQYSSTSSSDSLYASTTFAENALNNNAAGGTDHHDYVVVAPGEFTFGTYHDADAASQQHYYGMIMFSLFGTLDSSHSTYGSSDQYMLGQVPYTGDLVLRTGSTTWKTSLTSESKCVIEIWVR